MLSLIGHKHHCILFLWAKIDESLSLTLSLPRFKFKRFMWVVSPFGYRQFLVIILLSILELNVNNFVFDRLRVFHVLLSFRLWRHLNIVSRPAFTTTHLFQLFPFMVELWWWGGHSIITFALWPSSCLTIGLRWSLVFSLSCIFWSIFNCNFYLLLCLLYNFRLFLFLSSSILHRFPRLCKFTYNICLLFLKIWIFDLVDCPISTPIPADMLPYVLVLLRKVLVSSIRLFSQAANNKSFTCRRYSTLQGLLSYHLQTMFDWQQSFKIAHMEFQPLWLWTIKTECLSESFEALMCMKAIRTFSHHEAVRFTTRNWFVDQFELVW